MIKRHFPIGLHFDVEQRQEPAPGMVALAVVAGVVSIVAVLLLVKAG